MNKVRMNIFYRATLYSDNKQLLPPSAVSRAEEMSAILRHISGIGELLALANETHLAELSGDRLQLMLSNTGELLVLLTDAGFTVLNAEDEGESPSMFDEGRAAA